MKGHEHAMSRWSLRKRSSVKSFLDRLRAFARMDGGAAAIFFVVTAPVWIGGLGLGAEVGSWYWFQQSLQSTADSVASTLAGRVGTGASQAELSNLATEFLTDNKFDFAKGSVTLNLSSSGPVFKDGTTVELTLTRSVSRIITAFFQPGDFVIQAHAVAQVRKATQGCVLALSTSAVAALDVGNLTPADIRVTGCEVLSNANNLAGIRIQSGSQLTADCARVAGYTLPYGTLNVSCPDVQVQEAGLTLDPYVDLPEPDLTGMHCGFQSDYILDGVQHSQLPMPQIAPNGKQFYWFCDGARLTLAKGTSLTLSNPGLWIFDENATLEIADGISLGGSWGTFFFRNGGRLSIHGPHTSLRLTPPASGPLAGILFLGERTNVGVTNQITIGPGSFLNGVVYFPASAVQFQADGPLSGCPQIIADTVWLTGTWQLTGPCTKTGVRPIVASRVVKLTQ